LFQTIFNEIKFQRSYLGNLLTFIIIGSGPDKMFSSINFQKNNLLNSLKYGEQKPNLNHPHEAHPKNQQVS
jgi:hypothetical protein